ncbi:unnamed protein product, partial [Amoebophrya sp. A25]|eukprot:GSA25T00007749001.1
MASSSSSSHVKLPLPRQEASSSSTSTLRVRLDSGRDRLGTASPQKKRIKSSGSSIVDAMRKKQDEKFQLRGKDIPDQDLKAVDMTRAENFFKYGIVFTNKLKYAEGDQTSSSGTGHDLKLQSAEDEDDVDTSEKKLHYEEWKTLNVLNHIRCSIAPSVAIRHAIASPPGPRIWCKEGDGSSRLMRLGQRKKINRSAGQFFTRSYISFPAPLDRFRYDETADLATGQVLEDCPTEIDFFKLGATVNAGPRNKSVDVSDRMPNVIAKTSEETKQASGTLFNQDRKEQADRYVEPSRMEIQELQRTTHEAVRKATLKAVSANKG